MRSLIIILFLKLYIQLCSCEDELISGTVYLLNPLNECPHLSITFKTAVMMTMHHSVIVFQWDDESIDESTPITTILDKFRASQGSDVATVGLHLCVKDFNQTDYNEIRTRDFESAGDITHVEFVCRNKHTDLSKKDADDWATCKRIPERMHKVKLVSSNVDAIPKLGKLITEFREDFLIENQMVILICGDNTIRQIIEQTRLPKFAKIELNYYCTNLQRKNVLAILAPKPFVIEEELYTTTVFYDYQYDPIPEVADMFKNSVFMFNPEDKNLPPLKYAFLKSVQMMGAERVLIISDDSRESDEFERDLTSLFEQNNIIYVSKRCVSTITKTCDFSMAFESMLMLHADLLIVNVGEEYAEEFSIIAESFIKKRKNIEFLVRAWSSDVAYMASKKMNVLYSVTIISDPGPIKNDHHGYTTRDLQRSNLLLPLKIIKDMLQYDMIEYDLLKERAQQRIMLSYLSNVMNSTISFHMKTAPKSLYINAVINKYTKASLLPERVGAMFIERNYAVEIYRDTYLPSLETTKGECMFVNKSIRNPCNDIEMMLIMLVVAVFSLTLLGIVYFFQTTDLQYSRMAC